MTFRHTGRSKIMLTISLPARPSPSGHRRFLQYLLPTVATTDSESYGIFESVQGQMKIGIPGRANA